jgi:secreted trypsin-like serine protease
MRKLQILSWMTVVLVSSAASASVDVYVENGDPVPASDRLNRSVALMKGANHSCTASFISDITLLTAAHCIKGSASSVTIRIVDKQGRAYEEKVKALIRHPGYRIQNSITGTRVANDYGLIKLRKRMRIAVRPLRIVDARTKTGPFPVVVLGYGQTKKNISSSVLRRGRMTAIVEPLDPFFGAEGLHMVAADRDLNATCPGDSGGPVMYEDGGMMSLVGVHSLSSGCQGGQPTRSLSMLPVPVASWIWANYE